MYPELTSAGVAPSNHHARLISDQFRILLRYTNRMNLVIKSTIMNYLLVLFSVKLYCYIKIFIKS